MDWFWDLPGGIKLAAVCVLAAIGITLLVLAFEPRSRRTDQRQRHSAQRERRELREAKRQSVADTHVTPMTAHVTDGTSRTDPADKPPYQQADTADLVAVPRKLPGQDRLTRDGRTGMDVADPTVSAAADDHLSGAGSPSQRIDPAVPAEPPPPLRSSDPPLAQHPATTEMRAVRPPVPPRPPSTSQPRVPGETRAQRRAREADEKRPQTP